MNVLNNLNGQGKIIKSWCPEIEDGAMRQAINLSNLPFLFRHVVLMPDCHQGYGMPIGGVIATTGTVIPNAVGVDIGCGVSAIRYEFNEYITNDQIKLIMNLVRKNIPIGKQHRDIKVKDSAWSKKNPAEKGMIVYEEYDSSLYQLGTLGGGNHFIEFQKDIDNNLWCMVHSGSRNLGYRVANYYNKIANDLNKQWYSSVPKEFELAFLPLGSVEFKMYMKEMDLCVDFAQQNRSAMIEIINFAVYSALGITYGEHIDIPHNYASMENHFGKNVMVHRKGATLARCGQVGIIPGSQGTSSYIVEGLGNRESFCSCSHGAGRLMSRTKARMTINLSDEIKKLNESGIVHSIRNEKDLDEAPSAYKNIDDVMSAQSDLVKIKTKLTPIAVIKG